MITAEVLASLSDRCIHFTTPDADEYLIDDLLMYDITVIDLQGDVIASEEALFADFRDSMTAPSEIDTWESLYAYLVDTEKFNASGLVALVWNAEPWWQKAPNVAGAFVELWLRIHAELADDGRTAHLVFVFSDALEPFSEEEQSLPEIGYIQLHPVKSGMFRAIGYEAQSRILEAEFSDRRVYQIYRLPRRIYAECMNAESLGAYFNNFIRGEYETVKVSR